MHRQKIGDQGTKYYIEMKIVTLRQRKKWLRCCDGKEDVANK